MSTAEPTFPIDPHHRHDRSCHWDHRRCGWVCPPAPAPAAEEAATTPEPVADATPSPGTRALF